MNITDQKLYVSPLGDDVQDGSEAYPLRTLPEAMNRLAAMKWQEHGDARIILRHGRHELSQPLNLTPELCGVQEWIHEGNSDTIPINQRWLRFEAFPGEQPIISGAHAVTGWQLTKLNGLDVWVAAVPRLAGMSCRQLFVNGVRRVRARWPKKGFLRVRDIPGWESTEIAGRPAWMQGQDHFRCFEKDLAPWDNTDNAEIVFLQRWIESRTGLLKFDFSTQMALLDRPATYSIIHDGVDPEEPEGARFYIENILDTLSEPGEWMLDQQNSLLYYMPMVDETPNSVEVLVSTIPHLIKIIGNSTQSANLVSFKGIGFSHTEWSLPANMAGSVQSACDTPGAVILDNAMNCEFINCSFKSIGTYGLEMINGSNNNRIEYCKFKDLGAGGIKIWHRCRRNLVSDCEISDGGQIFHSGVGILIGQSAGNRILRNRIHDFYYTGIAVGWAWGYKESESYGNIIEYNHVYDIGKDWLSDMGGIYLLGMAPGTRVRFNVIHDIRSAVYGGIGIYPDEGSTDLLIEGNLVFDCRSFLISQHYGRRNTIRENLLINGEENQIALQRIENSQLALVFEHNILYYCNGMAFSGGYMNQTPEQSTLNFNHNIYWPIDTEAQFMELEFAAWQNMGFDPNSTVITEANELFNRLRNRILIGLDSVPGVDEALKKLPRELI